MNSYQKNTREKNPRYLRWLRTQPCWICGACANDNMDVVGAHQSLGYGKMGGKSHDFFALPECTTCHHIEHNPSNNQSNCAGDVEGAIREHIWRFLNK